jgi:hypothetical protein
MDEETALLTAVREFVRTALGLTETECDIDLDDIVPAIAGTRYAVVTPAGVQSGPHARTSTAVDRLLSVRVTMFHRISALPRDRRRNVFLEQNSGLYASLQKIVNAIDFNYAVITRANALMELPSGRGFVEPLRYASVDPKPGVINHDAYDAFNEPTKGAHPILGMKRGVTFSLARFMSNIRA